MVSSPITCDNGYVAVGAAQQCDKNLLLGAPQTCKSECFVCAC